MSEHTRVRAAELVPIADRLRYMQAFRLGAALVVALTTAAAGRQLLAPPATIAAATGAFLVVVAVAELVARRLRGHATVVFGTMLIVDGLYLAFVCWATGGPGSPIRYVIMLHLIAVAMLASYRTGLKLALWHSLLLVVVFYAERARLLARATELGVGVGTPFQRLIEFSALFWLVAIATASLAAINERELRRRRYDLEALAAMATRLESVSEPVDVADTLLDAVVDGFDFSRALVAVWRDGTPAHVVTARDTARRDPSDGELPPLSVLTVVTVERRTRLVAALEPRADAWLARLLPDARNLVVVPMFSEGGTSGALVAEHPKRIRPRIERRVVSMVERFVSHGALALQNAWLLERLRQVATLDGLTGLSNRSSFDEAVPKELARAARRDDDVSLLMIDIDHFKRLNDEHGHRAGDEVLRTVAAQLRDGCREVDVVARYGGEEFAVVLPATDAGAAAEVAERLRVAIAAALLEQGVTVSVGTATFPLDAATPDSLVEAADEALYESKRGGRNRVTRWHGAAAAEVEPVV